MAINVLTFGCRLNTYESEVMKRHAEAAGIADAIIVNTCAVTKEAERQARQAIRRARKERPGARLIVTGCAAQIDPASFAAMPEVDQVLGNAEKMQAGSYAAGRPFTDWHEKIRVNDIMEARDVASHMVAGFDGQTRAFVQVQNGCDHRCTFCIIPYGRGPSRSVPMGEIVAEVRGLVEAGYKEVVFTGVDVSDYGKDLPGNPTLGQMMTRVLQAVPELPRLRLSSIDAVEIDDALWRLIAEEPRLMPHLHISLQAGDDMVLKRMKRRHSRQDALDFCARARSLRPDIVFGADIIAGFPTEDEAMFDRTLALVEEAGLTWLHVFPYSERDGTPAARMPQVPLGLRKERAGRLREAGELQVAGFLAAQVGRTAQVLVEKNGMGRTEHFAPVKLGDSQAGSLSDVAIDSVMGHFLVAAGNVQPIPVP